MPLDILHLAAPCRLVPVTSTLGGMKTFTIDCDGIKSEDELWQRIATSIAAAPA